MCEEEEPMHGGLPFIGVSVLVYGLVGAVVIVRAALRRRRRASSAAPATAQGVSAWSAASR
ncbi:hypothetical protein H180DRAFT_05259 [Streptomyces sp. WMMB 322]|nr:hypothetical protein H180DRAFT_05259 [Streptomyces sp. WMMB 322]